jgi:hypothetical protein
VSLSTVYDFRMEVPQNRSSVSGVVMMDRHKQMDILGP